MRKIVFLIFVLSAFQLYAQSSAAIDKADQLYKEKKWAAAAVEFQQLFKINNVKGEYAYMWANALRRQDKFEASIKAYKEALELGYKKGRCIYFIARNYMLLEDKTKAIQWIQKGLKTPKSIRYADLNKTPFNALKKSKLFSELHLDVNTANSREESWKQDLDFFKKAFETIHFDLFKKITSEEWTSAIRAIKSKVKNVPDEALVVELMKLVSKIGDGHTFVRPPLQGKMQLHFYPMQLYRFKEGIFVTGINEQHKDLVGAELTHIDDMPIEKAIQRFIKTISVDNKMGYQENIYLLMFSEVLYNLKITKQKREAIFTFRTAANKELKMSMTSLDFDPALWNTKLSTDKELPLYRSRPNDFFWYQHLPETNTVYLQLNVNLSKPDKRISDFYDEVFEFIERKNVKSLILDIRNCPGGNSFNNPYLIKHILRSKQLQKKNSLYTIIGRKTFSAAMNLATDLEQWTHTLFVGEPTGSSPNFIGETNFVELPNSKLNISISNAYWQKSVSWDHRKWIAPDVYIEPTFEAYKTNKDPVLEYILNELK